MRERISIHAPHEGERPDGADNITDLAHISIHAPHEGERLLRLRGVAVKGAFQSTLPTRGSDLVTDALKGEDTDFNPRSPRGGATQAPRHKGRGQLFQSTLPTRGSDDRLLGAPVYMSISIHAPHEGERLILRPPRADYMQFQSTLPTRGSDKGPKPRRELKIIFQSTLPTRGSDSKYPRAAAFFTAISIHAPHEGERPRSQ